MHLDLYRFVYLLYNSFSTTGLNGLPAPFAVDTAVYTIVRLIREGETMSLL
jgi:hypothetical protein